METVHLVVIFAFIIQGIALVTAGYFLKKKGIRAWGRPTIHPGLFYTGKISLFSSWALFLLKAIVPDLGWITAPGSMELAGAILLCFGSIVLVVSFFNLNHSLRVGLPVEETVLITHGPYSFSRNPIYLGVFIICIASCIFFPDPVNIVLALYGMFVHHLIIRGEEKFLEERFGEKWRTYKAKVGRYI